MPTPWGALEEGDGGIKEAWEDTATKPTWKIDQENPPMKCDVKMKFDDDAKPRWMSRIAFEKYASAELYSEYF